MKCLIFSIISSITFGLFVYWGYLYAVTGLSSTALGVLGIFLTGLLILNVRLVKKSNNKVVALVGLLLFGLLLPCALIVTKKWDADKNHVRQYQKSTDR